MHGAVEIATTAVPATTAAPAPGGVNGFWDNLLDVGTSFGTSLLQLDIFNRANQATANAAAGVNGGINGPAIAAQQAAAAQAAAQGNSGFAASLSDPKNLMFIGLGVVMLILLFATFARSK